MGWLAGCRMRRVMQCMDRNGRRQVAGPPGASIVEDELE